MERTREEQLKKSRTFCLAPWTHIHTWPNGDVFTCCMAPMEMPVGNLRKNSLKEIWNNEKMRKLRLDLLEGKRVDQCKHCYNLEDVGSYTLRNELNKNFGDHWKTVETTDIDGNVAQLNLPYFDFRFSNLCNFRCRTCGPELSSSWYEDDVAMFGPREANKLDRPYNDPEDLWRQVEPHLDQLEEVYFAGGEPLLMEEHYRILNHLVERKKFNVRLKYNTNFSLMNYKGQDVMRIWDKFDRVMVGASLDAEAERGEFMRKGQRWNQVVKNRERMLEICPRAEFFISPTLGAMNSLHLPDFHRSWVEKGYIKISDININLVQVPTLYRIQVLPQKLKERVRDKYQRHIDEFIVPYSKEGERARHGFEYAVRFMDKEEHQSHIPDFKKRTQKLDKVRKEKFFDVFPELKGVY